MFIALYFRWSILLLNSTAIFLAIFFNTIDVFFYKILSLSFFLSVYDVRPWFRFEVSIFRNFSRRIWVTRDSFAVENVHIRYWTHSSLILPSRILSTFDEPGHHTYEDGLHVRKAVGRSLHVRIVCGTVRMIGKGFCTRGIYVQALRLAQFRCQKLELPTRS